MTAHAGDAAPPQPEPDDLGGDPACWLNRVCPECGLFVEERDAAVCPRCHAELPRD